MAGPGRVAGLLLAAGESSRMGKPKQLLPVGGVTLLGRVLAEALSSQLDTVVLVLGHEAEAIRRALAPTLEHPKLIVQENERYKEGISSSIIAGLSRVERSHDHVMILLADMPHITSGLIDLLLRGYLSSHLPIGAISLKGARSHPVIFHRQCYPYLHRLKGDEGAKGLFREFPDRICLVEADTCYNDRDIDTPEDYLEFQESMKEGVSES
jgi:molybdenum cofactor cytidylyltransferase